MSDILKQVESCIAGSETKISDTLACALCAYFDGHWDKPDNDEVDDETGQSVWSSEQADALLSNAARDVYYVVIEPMQLQITRLSLLVSKYEAAIDEHKRSKLYAFDPDFKLWQTREK